MKIKGADNQGRRGRRREHPQPTFGTTTKKNAREIDVISCNQLPVKMSHMGILRNFRLGMRTPFHPFGSHVFVLLL